jgi:hypothetical protein
MKALRSIIPLLSCSIFDFGDITRCTSSPSINVLSSTTLELSQHNSASSRVRLKLDTFPRAIPTVALQGPILAAVPKRECRPKTNINAFTMDASTDRLWRNQERAVIPTSRPLLQPSTRIPQRSCMVNHQRISMRSGDVDSANQVGSSGYRYTADPRVCCVYSPIVDLVGSRWAQRRWLL